MAAVTCVALLVAEENWRGKRAWEQFKREWEAKGEQFDLASFLPKPVPASNNFAATPYLAAMFQKNGNFEGRPSGGTQESNATTLQVNLYGSASNWPSFGGFEKGNLTDLQKWQQFYRGNASFPSAPQPQDPARDVLLALGKFDSILSSTLGS